MVVKHGREIGLCESHRSSNEDSCTRDSVQELSITDGRRQKHHSPVAGPSSRPRQQPGTPVHNAPKKRSPLPTSTSNLVRCAPAFFTEANKQWYCLWSVIGTSYHIHIAPSHRRSGNPSRSPRLSICYKESNMYLLGFFSG